MSYVVWWVIKLPDFSNEYFKQLGCTPKTNGRCKTLLIYEHPLLWRHSLDLNTEDDLGVPTPGSINVCSGDPRREVHPRL